MNSFRKSLFYRQRTREPRTWIPAASAASPKVSRTSHRPHRVGRECAAIRDPETIEPELMEISSIADDLGKFERIVAWCAAHPDEGPSPYIS